MTSSAADVNTITAGFDTANAAQRMEIAWNLYRLACLNLHTAPFRKTVFIGTGSAEIPEFSTSGTSGLINVSYDIRFPDGSTTVYDNRDPREYVPTAYKYWQFYDSFQFAVGEGAAAEVVAGILDTAKRTFDTPAGRYYWQGRAAQILDTGGTGTFRPDRVRWFTWDQVRTDFNGDSNRRDLELGRRNYRPWADPLFDAGQQALDVAGGARVSGANWGDTWGKDSPEMSNFYINPTNIDSASLKMEKAEFDNGQTGWRIGFDVPENRLIPTSAVSANNLLHGVRAFATSLIYTKLSIEIDIYDNGFPFAFKTKENWLASGTLPLLGAANLSSEAESELRFSYDRAQVLQGFVAQAQIFSVASNFSRDNLAIPTITFPWP
jgi:hypothetical protein